MTQAEHTAKYLANHSTEKKEAVQPAPRVDATKKPEISPEGAAAIAQIQKWKAEDAARASMAATSPKAREEQWRLEFAHSPALQAEFRLGGVESYVAYKKAQFRGWNK